MNKTVKHETAKDLDQFYTNKNYAKHFLDKIDQLVDRSIFEMDLEPRAGTGSFFSQLNSSKRIGVDLDPKIDEVIKSDFFNWKCPVNKKIITIGNPPFGKNANLAVQFFNKAAEFSDVIAFILPRTFRKISITNRLNLNFHCIYDETVPDNSFIFNNESYDVWCCAQIWVKLPEQRQKVKPKKISDFAKWFSMAEPQDATFSIQRVGGRAGMIRTKDFSGYSKESHYFFKTDDNKVLEAFSKIDFSCVKYNTVGNPSVSPNELLELWVEQAKVLGLLADC